MIKFKSVALVFFILSLFSVSSCKKEKNQGDVVLEYTIPFIEKMQIDVNNIDSFIERESYSFPTQFDDELAKNNTNKSKIKSAKLIFMRIQVIDYAYLDTSNYSNLKDISDMEVYAKNDNVGTSLIATKSIPDLRTKAVNMDLQDVELRDYLKQDNFNMIFRYKKRRAMPNEMPFIISLKFKIIADPL
jgi:hypothetical protein